MSDQSLASALLNPRAADPALDERYWTPVVPSSAAGMAVTGDTAMMVSAVYRAVALLSNAFASLPMMVFRRLEQGRELVPEHEARRLFALDPNPYQGPLEFKRLLMGHVVLRGNAFARIFRRRGRVELWPLHPDRVRGPELLESGRLRYRYRRPDTGMEEIYIGGRDILHIPGLSSDGLRGLALVDQARETIGVAIAAERHGGRSFSQGVRLSGVLKTDHSLNPETRLAMEDSFAQKFAGESGVKRVPVLEQGLEWQSVGMTNEDAQWLETRKFTISDIARWFGIPPHMLGDVERSTSWGTGIEHQSIQFVQYGLTPWLVQWEETIKALFIPEPDMFARFNVEGLLRADSKTRHQIYAIAIRSGIYSPDECRELENRNPRPGGERYVDVASIGTGGGAAGPTLAEMPPREVRAKPAEGVACQLAEAQARSVIDLEQVGLMRGAEEHAKDGKKWRASVGSFYGRFAVKVCDIMSITPEDAKTYCNARKACVLESGLAALDNARAERELVELALGRADQ